MSIWINTFIELPIGLLLEHSSNWDAACQELGLNPYCINEGTCSRFDLVSLTIGQAMSFGLLPEWGDFPLDPPLNPS